jgi:helicase
MLTVDTDGERRLRPTELGRMTARLMVPPAEGDRLRQALLGAAVPASAGQAEAVLAGIVATTVPKLARARVSDDAKAALARLLASYDQAGRALGPGRPPGQRQPGAQPGGQPLRGDLARAALLTVANEPGAFRPGVRQIGGVPYPAIYQVLEEAPRYLHWLASQGLFGTIHPCWAIVAADLELRVAWRMLQPPRGSGRLLWACEQMATPAEAAQVVPRLWRAARARGHTSPDWPGTGRPSGSRLDAAGYLAFLGDRATTATIEIADGVVTAQAPTGSVLAVWTGSEYLVTPVRRGSATARQPPGDPGDLARNSSGAAVFTWRGDYRATGWLAAYSRLHDQNQEMERTGVTPSAR